MSMVNERNEKGQSYFLPGFLESLEETWGRLRDGVKYTVGEMERGDEGPAWLRAQMPSQFNCVPLQMLRDGIARLNKSGRAGKTQRKKTAPQRMEDLAERMIQAFPPSSNGHSEEYEQYQTSAEGRNQDAAHKRRCDYRCQLCGRIRKGEDLQVHHSTYDHLGAERVTELLCLCVSPCHKIADAMRRWGFTASGGDDPEFTLFDNSED